ncbi:hypothetical protein GQR58_002098 [Nymphon striatum]|nr:hypothetical protein GQR58_002098 [Nymphon striatum]
MSDPVTNVEIEDVLSSIRRLVSDGDKARTRDPAPVEVTTARQDNPVQAVSESTPETAVTDRLVLTPAFLVSGGDTEHANEGTLHDTYDEALEDNDQWQEEEWAQPAEATQSDDASADEARGEDENGGDEAQAEPTPDVAPLTLTERVDEETAEPIAAAPDSVSVPDRSGLVATIAELEAAMSESTDEFEPDGSEPMAETIPWPGAPMRVAEGIEDADVSEDQAADDPIKDTAPIEEDVTAAIQHHDDAPSDIVKETSEDPKVDPSDDYDDDLDGLLDVGGATLDEEALRELVSEVVREELTGPLGERITRNVRKLVRREIYRILSSQEFD